MNWIGQYHPLIVHTPIALLIFSAVFAVAGRLFDRDWVRRASVLMLVFGFLGAFAAVRSGAVAHHVPEHDQGVSEEAIDDHGELGQYTMYVAGAAVVAVFVASRLAGSAAGAVGMLALLLQIAAAVMVGVTGHRGGQLVYQHGANVRIGGQLVKDVGGGDADEAAPGKAAAADSSRPAPAGSAARDKDKEKDKDKDKD